MNFLRQSRQILTALVLVLVLTVTTACGGASQATQRPQLPGAIGTTYNRLERGSTAPGQKYGDWVVQTAKGLIQDAYVRDNNKLGVVIGQQIRPNEVKDLARSLAEGFRKNFPDRDLTVLVYAPDKRLILTARYDDRTKQIQYQ